MALGLGGRTSGFGRSPSTATNDPFYQYNQWQEENGFDWTKTPVIGGPSGYLERNPEVTYNRWLTSMGIGQADTSEYAKWLRGLFGETQMGFQTGLAENPTLTYQDYLQTLGANINPVTGVNALRQRWEGYSPQQRGVDISRFAGPTRTISDL